MTETQIDPPLKKAKTAAQLKKAAVFEDVTLPSGVQVDIRLPNITEMIAAGAIPNDLIDAAVEAAAQKDKPDTKTTAERVEAIKQDWQFVKFIIPKVLVTPEATPDDVEEISPSDLDLLVALAARLTDLDAIGHQLGGLETQASFRRHRGIVDLDAVLEGAS